MSLSNQIVTEICEAYQLGTMIAPIKEISGGSLHKLWQLQTNQGIYALKQIQQNNIALLKDNLLSPERSQEIAAFMQKNGIPTISALQHNGHYIVTLDQQPFMVMPWLQGETLADANINLATIRKIGNLLAQIHLANFVDEQIKLPSWKGLTKHEWQNLIALIQIPEMIVTLQTELPNLILWSEHANQVSDILCQELVFSHRDLDEKNVIWQKNNALILLDWEYAGLINPHLDLFIVALNWSGILSGTFSKEKYQAIICGFNELQTLNPTPSIEIFYGYVGYCLDWIIFNLRKLSYGFSHICQLEVMNTLRVLHYVIKSENLIMELNRNN